eukprot:m.9591 g.9591  ORF g.9591 m.9591 type:complete len:98 (-) comp3495_c0_seq2:197-490(-)
MFYYSQMLYVITHPFIRNALIISSASSLLTSLFLISFFSKKNFLIFFNTPFTQFSQLHGHPSIVRRWQSQPNQPFLSIKLNEMRMLNIQTGIICKYC